MKIVFDPSSSKTNKYVEILGDLLHNKGVQIYSLNGFYAKFSALRSLKVIHLNWYENLSGNELKEVLPSFLKKTIKLFTLKMLGKKIIWTMHNKMPHDQSVPFLKKTMMHYMLHLSDTIIIHSWASKDLLLNYNKKLAKKIKYIPHPNYIGWYGDNDSSVRKVNSDTLQLLFIGSVKPYKNIELLIDVVKAFPFDILLTIAGKPESEEYGMELKEYALGASNVKLELNFVPDERMIDYIFQSDLLVLPYDLSSSLNSGTAMLAFSYARTVICPSIGTISDLQDQSNVLAYSYNTENHHYKALFYTINKAAEMKKNSLDVFENLGSEMFKYVSMAHNNETIVQDLLQEYQKLAS